ncbi:MULTISPECIES: GNAT family N-acetyltransferase [unclassified Streptomyces]|uniref:GNAT family N-acetyltransferase n=1 Tax=unclassified Streptomyces TaxID=2593676 RepID=UPI0029BB162B|nr:MULTISPECIES: GNAT family N-acetyltransferase [unclassified Streptomyces]MDX3771758.1 GNAT family N-acetyltransferase [Streptomyces sp. AK08-01B]MDX3820817.1 GNAT family N-acetyltransferase [Streptomyces sp. AK08-01A]
MLKDTAGPDGVIRPATEADLPAIAHLCAAHAAFERAGAVSADLATRLKPVLFSARPRAWCLGVDHGGELIGYATCSREFSTWQATDYVHLDCLFVTEPHRGEGWGKALLNAVKKTAAHGAAQVQWQTPDWNTDAIRFYRRAGAQALPKVRFSLPVGLPESSSCSSQ